MQRYCALHAVEPNCESSLVCAEPHRGHGITVVARRSGLIPATSMRPPDRCGGAIPNAASFPFASAAIQSVLHGGDEPLHEIDVVHTDGGEPLADERADHLGRRAAGIGRRDFDAQPPAMPGDVAHDPQGLDDRDHRNFGVGHRGERVPHRADRRQRGRTGRHRGDRALFGRNHHQAAPG